jgi:hypothetical protein
VAEKCQNGKAQVHSGTDLGEEERNGVPRAAKKPANGPVIAIYLLSSKIQTSGKPHAKVETLMLGISGDNQRSFRAEHDE